MTWCAQWGFLKLNRLALKNVQKTQRNAPEDSSFLGRAQNVHFPLALRALLPIPLNPRKVLPVLTIESKGVNI